ncbi:MAG: Ig-like domain-containing protein [Clostridia bacterium]
MKKPFIFRFVIPVIVILFITGALGTALADQSTGTSIPALETDAVATLAATNLGSSGIYTGDVTLLAPEGFELMLSENGAVWEASVTKAFAADGVSTVAYRLRRIADGGVTAQKYIRIAHNASIPTVALASPGAGAVASGAQRMVLSLSEQTVAIADKYIILFDGTNSYQARATDAQMTGGPDVGPWNASLALSAFTPALTLSAGTTYTIQVDAGAFVDAAGNQSAAMPAVSIPMGAQQADTKLVVYGLGSGWSVETVGETGTAVASGTAVPTGTHLMITAPENPGGMVAYTVKQDGTLLADVNLMDFVVNGELTIFAAVTKPILKGMVDITGTARVGETLSGTVTTAGVLSMNGNNSAPALTYTWKKGDVILATGGENTTYMVRAGDIGSVLTLSVTGSGFSGELTAQTPSVNPNAAAAPAAPTVAAVTDTSITLNAVIGCEYSRDAISWQSSPMFDGLTAGQSYSFYQRYQKTMAMLASDPSPVLQVSTVGQLTGTVVVSGTLQVGQTVNALLTGSNNTGSLGYVWKRGITVLSNAAAYTIQVSDIGSPLTVEIKSSVETGILTLTTAAVKKATVTAPIAPTAASVSASTVTLNAIVGYEYSMGGTNWQDTTTFHNLTMGSVYSFYQRVKETAQSQASAASPAAQIATISGLTGTLTVSGDIRYGKTLVAALTGSNNSGTLNYVWRRGNMIVGSGQTYDVNIMDIGNPLYAEVASSTQGGTLTKLVGTVQKAVFIGVTPEAPARESRTSTSITLIKISGYEYSRDGQKFQDSNVFSGLSAGKTYSFYQRVKATTTVDASPVSNVLKASTSSPSSGSTPGDSTKPGGSTGSGATPTPDSNSGSAAALTSYALSSDNTRILFSTMQSLIKGNEKQDVTIKTDNVTYTFFKGTMKLTAGTLWYDFGTSINGCVHENSAKQIAGDKYVATIHFNYDGELPAKANIRIWLGAAQAGKTLYYYKLDPAAKTLSYLQTAVADSSGNVTVVQSSCSDYVFLSQELSVVAETPASMETPASSASPSPTALLNEPGGSAHDGFGVGGWMIAVMILVALLLIVIGIRAYLKSRAEEDDEDDEF